MFYCRILLFETFAEDFISKVRKEISELRENVSNILNTTSLIQGIEFKLFFNLVVSLKRKSWIFALIVPKFINYNIEPKKFVNLIEKWFIEESISSISTGWNNIRLIVFEGWLLMIRYLINNNPNSVELLFHNLFYFFSCLKKFLENLISTVVSSNRDCFFKLITCIQVTLRKIDIVCSKNFTSTLMPLSLKEYLSFTKTISKMNGKSFTFDVISKTFNDFLTKSSFVLLK